MSHLTSTFVSLFEGQSFVMIAGDDGKPIAFISGKLERKLKDFPMLLSSLTDILDYIVETHEIEHKDGLQTINGRKARELALDGFHVARLAWDKEGGSEEYVMYDYSLKDFYIFINSEFQPTKFYEEELVAHDWYVHSSTPKELLETQKKAE